MKEKGRRILEVAAITAGISGITLSELRQNNPVIFYAVYIVLIALCFFVALTWKKINRFSNKRTINSIWQHLLDGSQLSIQVFAGDVSWINRDEAVIKRSVEDGLEVSVLCRRPGTNKMLKDNISKLIETGAEVRYYDGQDNPVVRGLVIDGKEKGMNTALTVQKTAQKNIQRRYGEPGARNIYSYRAVRYIPPQDTQYIETLHQLFHFISDKALPGMVLQPVTLDFNKIAGLLAVVPHYAGSESLKLKTGTVHIRQLWSSCLYVKEYKFRDIRAILDAHETQDFRCFEPCVCLSHVRKCLLLPPILERHKDRLVVIDGIHRLYCRYLYGEKPEAECLIIEGVSPLPGEPVPFIDLNVTPRKLPREQNFTRFKPERYRNIDSLENALIRFVKPGNSN